MGGEDFFSNGIHLNVIEAADDQGEESYYNLHAIDDIMQRDPRDRVAPRRQRAAGRRRRRRRAVRGRRRPRGRPRGRRLQPVLPAHGRPLRLRVLDLRPAAPRRRADAAELTSAPFDPIGTRRAKEIGLIDDAFGADLASFRTHLAASPSASPATPTCRRWLAEKRRRRAADEAAKPLASTAPRRWRSRTSASSARPQLPRGAPAFVWKTGAPCAVPVAAAPSRCSSPARRSSPVGAHAAPVLPAPRPSRRRRGPAEMGWRLVSARERTAHAEARPAPSAELRTSLGLASLGAGAHLRDDRGARRQRARPDRDRRGPTGARRASGVHRHASGLGPALAINATLTLGWRGRA